MSGGNEAEGKEAERKERFPVVAHSIGQAAPLCPVLSGTLAV